MTDNTVDWNTYCGYPFNHLAMKEYQGDQLYQAWPCCNVGRYGRDHVSIQGVNNLTPDQIFEHPRLEQLRHNLLSGIKDPICTVCWRMEDQLQTRSHRQYSPGYEQKIPVPKKLTSVNLRTSGMCNLRCRMCYTTDTLKNMACCQKLIKAWEPGACHKLSITAAWTILSGIG